MVDGVNIVRCRSPCPSRMSEFVSVRYTWIPNFLLPIVNGISSVEIEQRIDLDLDHHPSEEPQSQSPAVASSLKLRD